MPTRPSSLADQQPFDAVARAHPQTACRLRICPDFEIRWRRNKSAATGGCRGAATPLLVCDTSPARNGGLGVSHGFAYGGEGTKKLAGKILATVSTGGDARLWPGGVSTALAWMSFFAPCKPRRILRCTLGHPFYPRWACDHRRGYGSPEAYAAWLKAWPTIRRLGNGCGLLTNRCFPRRCCGGGAHLCAFEVGSLRKLFIGGVAVDLADKFGGKHRADHAHRRVWGGGDADEA